ncbi:hypothetical protein V8D89_008641 [Ganoderma adspersum]
MENFDEVRAQLIGKIHTRLRRNKRLYEEKHRIVSFVFSLWSRGSAYPEPGTDILRLPFRFLLPDGLPPSFHFHVWEVTSVLLYTIDTIGVRLCKFKENKKVHTLIIALPKDDAGVSIPDVVVLPLFTPLSFLITITTMTAPMTRAKALSHPSNKPSSPRHPRHEAVAFFFGAGTVARDVVAEVEVAEKEWHPKTGETGGGAGERGGKMGRWLQRASFSSKFTPNVPRTFSAPTIAVNYYLSLKVPFPGMGNDILLKVPVTITSGINEPWDKSEPQTQPRPDTQSSSPTLVTEPKLEPQTRVMQDDPHSDAPVSVIDVRRHSSTYKAPRGEVMLEFGQMQEEQVDEVVLEFRGRLKVFTENTAQRTSTVSRELIHLRKSIWKRGSTYYPPDSHILRIPFRFHLPSGPHTLPSVIRNEWHDVVSIMYYVEVTALRPATFFANNKRVRERLVVVSRGHPTLCASIRSLKGLEGGLTWKMAHTEHQMRRGLWEEYSTARVELLVPHEHGILPHCVPIPVLIKINTTTTRLSRTEAGKHPEGKPIFPAIALDSNHNNPISINMLQNFTVRARGNTNTSTNESVLAYVTEKDLLPSSYYNLHWQADTTPSDKEEMGRWVQQWTLQPTVTVNRFPPTFSSDLVDCAYAVSVQVPFSGMGNDVKVTIPITLDSGIDQATPQQAGRGARELQEATTVSFDSDTSSDGGTDLPVLRDEQPPSQPPTYFDAVFDDEGVRDERDRAQGAGAPDKRPEQEVDRAALHDRERAREVQVHDLDSLRAVHASEEARCTMPGKRRSSRRIMLAASKARGTH